MSILTIIIAILIFGILVLIHEMGHFFVAKAFDTRIYEFAIGMGPTIIKKKKGETTYSLRAIPVGGFVRFDAYSKPEYETEEEALKDTKEYEIAITDQRTLSQKAPWKRMLVLFAGSFMNFVLAMVLFIGIYTYLGYPTTVIDRVSENMPAYTSGIKSGDTIVKIQGEDINKWEDISKLIGSSEDGTIDIQVKDNEGQLKEYSVATVIQDGKPKIGITPTYGKSLIEGTKTAVEMSTSFVKLMIDALSQLFVGKAEMENFAGPVGIITVVGDAVKVGPLYILNITAMLSLNLAVLNLMPFPALDGGHIIITFIEMIRKGKKLSPKIENSIHLVGFALIFSFVIFLTFKDVGRLIGG